MYRAHAFLLGGALAIAGCGGGGPKTPDAGPPDARVDAGRPDAREDGLGSVENIPGSCANGTLPRTMCRLLRVSCPGVAPRDTEIRIMDPPTGVTRIGTVLVGTGGGGTTYYEEDPVARAMLLELSAAGYRIVQRQWFGTDGWIEGPGGFDAVSCRYASLLQYTFENIHQASLTEALCVTGNSGGASEIAYALARYNLGHLLELAVPTGGPPMSRLDHGCLDADDTAWQAECATLVGTNLTCTPASCAYVPAAQELVDSAYADDACATADEGARTTLLADSAAAPGNTFAYPMPIHFLFGADDCTEAVPLGLAFAAEVTSAKQIDFIPATPHAVFSTTDGANAIRDAIVDGCVLLQ
jgi:hypothetical protein